MKTKFVANWEVEDGYVGKSRPQRSEICVDDIEEDMDLEEIEECISDQIQEDFQNRIAWACTNLSELAEEIQAHLSTIKEDDDE